MSNTQLETTVITPEYVRKLEYAALHNLTRGAMDYYIANKRLRMKDGSAAVLRDGRNYFVHRDATILQVPKPRSPFTFGRKALVLIIALSVYSPVYAADYTILDDGQQTVVQSHALNHAQRPLIFKQKHPVFWKATAPFRRCVWHPLVMVGKKTGVNKLASIASDSFIKMGEVTQPYHAGGTTVNTALGLAATAGLFLRGK